MLNPSTNQPSNGNLGHLCPNMNVYMSRSPDSEAPFAASGCDSWAKASEAEDVEKMGWELDNNPHDLGKPQIRIYIVYRISFNKLIELDWTSLIYNRGMASYRTIHLLRCSGHQMQSWNPSKNPSALTVQTFVRSIVVAKFCITKRMVETCWNPI